jgi:lipopolysaccharide biosynthesis glycosyltransferase
VSATIHVACAADRRYLPHSGAMLHSVLSAERGADVQIHFLHGPSVPDQDLRRLAQMVASAGGLISFHHIDIDRVDGLPEWGRIPATMWYRIFLPELLPDVDRALYLDIDTLAVDSLAPLWELDLDGRYLAAVTNVPERHMLQHAEQLGLGAPQDYFNSGVLLMNLELMRRDRCSEALRACALNGRGRLLWPDQDTLNLVLGHRRLALHPRWNLMNSVRAFPWSAELLGQAAVEEAIARPAIVHFEGPRENKPWHLLCDHPLRGAYFRHRQSTPWPRCRRAGVTPANIARLAAQRLTAIRAV